MNDGYWIHSACPSKLPTAKKPLDWPLLLFLFAPLMNPHVSMRVEVSLDVDIVIGLFTKRDAMYLTI
jgi:hypothetical protein